MPKDEGGKAGKDGKTVKNHAYQDYGMEKSQESGFWLGVWHAVIEFIAPDPVPYKKMVNENYTPFSFRFYQSFHKESVADEEGIVEQQEKIEPPKEDKLPEGFVSTYSEDLYNTVMIPYGVTEKERDDYVLTSYVNDVNRENTQVLMEYGTDGYLSNTYDFGVARNSRTHYDRTEYYAYDGRGSVANLFNSSGSAVVSYSYEVSGKVQVQGETSNQYDYNGEYTDKNTGLQYLRARYYNPENNNFITQDDYLGELMEPLSQNQYTYVENDPINYQDPSGHRKVSPADIFGAAAGAAVGMLLGNGVASKVVEKSVSHAVSTTLKKSEPVIRRKIAAEKLKKKGYVPLVLYANVLSEDAYNQQLLKDQKYYETGMANRYAAGAMKKAEARMYKKFCEKAEKAKDKESRKKALIINDQRRKDITSKDFGMWGNVGDNGCGAVAVYNTLILMGADIKFDTVLKLFNQVGGISTTLAGGKLGARPSFIAKIFEELGFTAKWVSPGMAKKGADGYIVLYGYSVGAHYQAAEYTDDGIKLYNQYRKVESFKKFADRKGNIGTIVLEIRRKK